MFKHLTKLFDDEDLPVLVNRYEQLRANGKSLEAEAIRVDISYILANGRNSRSLDRRG